MIIKELLIKNFRSYYGSENSFEFNDGLTLILGANGDGKTTFFEALAWLLDTTTERSSIDLVSEMRKSEMEIGDSDKVSVYMLFDHDGEKSVDKSFTFEKTGVDSFKVSPINYHGYEMDGSERVSISGKMLIDRCYDAFIQRFSMFKGSDELNVFNDAAALKQLVNKFSDIRKFDTLVEYTTSFEDKANANYMKEMKSDQRVSKKAGELEQDILKLKKDIFDKKADIKDKEDSINFYTTQLTSLEANQEASEKYRDLQKREQKQEEKKTKLLAQITRVNYNHSLLDNLWILCPFPEILTEFQKKSSALSKDKRTQEKEFIKEQAKAKAKLETIKEIQGALINGATELPWYLPDVETMEDMIKDHICKVCGREAKEGTDAYNFMVHRLEEYRRHVEATVKKEQAEKELEEQVLFPNNYIDDIHNLSITLSGSEESKVAQLTMDIKDRLEMVERFTLDLKNVEEKLQDLQDEKSRLLIQAGNVSETLLEKQFKDIKGLFTEKERAEKRLVELKSELKIMETDLSGLQTEFEKLDPSSSQVKVYRDIHRALQEISAAFKRAKASNLKNFLNDLEDRANYYLNALSADDFHGTIRLVEKANETTEIKLYSSNGTEVTKPSGSQGTTMYISVLFAISDFTKNKRDEDYPLIFDAPTSSFDSDKVDEFYKEISKVQKQCIIVTKDFIVNGNINDESLSELNCPIYRIQKLKKGFNQDDLSTIRTIISKIK